MTMKRFTMCGVLVMAACDGGDDPGQPDAAMDAPPDAPTTVVHGGTVRSFDPATFDISNVLNQPALPGAEVCIIEGAPPACVTTDAQGRWSLDLPRSSRDVRLTFSHPTHLDYYWVWWSFDVDEIDSHHVVLVPDAIAQGFYEDCAAPDTPIYPELTTAGALIRGSRFVRGVGGNPDRYFLLDGGTVTAAAAGTSLGPCYMSAPYEHDTAQQTTSVAGLGFTLFGNMSTAAPNVDVTVTYLDATCTAYLDLVPSLNNVVQVPVRAGFQTVIDVICEE